MLDDISDIVGGFYRLLLLLVVHLAVVVVPTHMENMRKNVTTKKERKKNKNFDGVTYVGDVECGDTIREERRKSN